MLKWDFVGQHMATAAHYWLTTLSPDASPYVQPTRGGWHENLLYFDGAALPNSSWIAIKVEVERGDAVVILHGRAQRVPDDDPVITSVLDSYQRKYPVQQPCPLYYLALIGYKRGRTSPP